MSQSFKDLIIWQKSMRLCHEIYKLTSALPQSELYGISSQIQRAAVSVPSNIAEGFQRHSKKEFVRFLLIAYGSCAEVETQLLLIKDLFPGLNLSPAVQATEEASRTLNVFIKRIKLELVH